MRGSVRDGRLRPHRRRGPAFAAALVLAVGVAGCRPTMVGRGPVRPGPLDVATPEPGDVDAVVFLVGDAGNAFQGRSPLLRHLSAEVERWAAALPRDSAVAVVFLGDNVYEVGVRGEDHPEYRTDLDHLAAQVAVVAGDVARERGVRGVFLPGNHDWGNLVGEAGVERLENQERELALQRAGGAAVELRPPAGHPGPDALHVGGTRLVLLDTHWWLQERSSERKDSLIAALADTLASAEPTLVLAHHPLLSAGEHGGRLAPLRDAGLRFIANRSGILVQDLSSGPYSHWIERARAIFERTPPLLYAAGHEHTLQVFRDSLPSGAVYAHLVSGAGSKVGPVSAAPGLEWAAGAPGYMRVVVRRDGSAVLHVFAGDPERLTCPPVGRSGYAGCMRDGVAAVRPVYTGALRQAPRG